MFRRIPASEDEALVECLREEARQTRPEFSEALHRRVWQTCSRRRDVEALRPKHAAHVRPVRLALAAGALAGLLACTMIAWYGWRSVRPEALFSDIAAQEHEGPTSPPRGGGGVILLTDWGHEGAMQLDRLASSVVSSHEWGCLGHDAQLALSAFAQDCPLPQSRQRTASPLPSAP
jgi:hypothetical protein